MEEFRSSSEPLEGIVSGLLVSEIRDRHGEGIGKGN